MVGLTGKQQIISNVLIAQTTMTSMKHIMQAELREVIQTDTIERFSRGDRGAAGSDRGLHNSDILPPLKSVGFLVEIR